DRLTRRLFVQLNPSRDRGLDRGASCRFGLLCEHHQLVTWLNVRTLFAARSKRCSSITCIIELFSPAPRADSTSGRWGLGRVLQLSSAAGCSEVWYPAGRHRSRLRN